MNDNYDLILEKKFYQEQLQRFKNSDSEQVRSQAERDKMIATRQR